MKKHNIHVEKFFMVTIPKRREKEGLNYNLSDCHKALMNYYLETELEDLFNSKDYVNEEERAAAMFGFLLTSEELKMISLKFYKHRAEKHGGNHDKRIKELEAEITDPELAEIVPLRWWLN